MFYERRMNEARDVYLCSDDGTCCMMSERATVIAVVFKGG